MLDELRFELGSRIGLSLGIGIGCRELGVLLIGELDRLESGGGEGVSRGRWSRGGGGEILYLSEGES